MPWSVSFGINKAAKRREKRVNLAYTCVRHLVRLYVCQRVVFFMTHFGSILGPFWVHIRSILGPFGVHLGSIRDPFGIHSGSIWRTFGEHSDNCLNTDASLGFRAKGFNQYLDKNQLPDKSTLWTRILVEPIKKRASEASKGKRAKRAPLWTR